MTGTVLAPAGHPTRRGSWSWLMAGVQAAWRGLTLSLLAVAGTGPLLALALLVVLTYSLLRQLAGEQPQGPDLARLGFVPIVLAVASLVCLRRLTGLSRRLAGSWCGRDVAAPYRPRPDGKSAGAGGQLRQWLTWLLTDPATWRDLLWLPVSLIGAAVLAFAPAAVVLYGLVFAVLPALGLPVWNIPYVGILTAKGPGAAFLGVLLVIAGLWLAPRLLPAYGVLTRAVLGPTGRAELSGQVEHLALSRSATIDAGAAELRRIERDLHDGAQARLVAMGMTLDAAEQMLDDNPAAVRALLAEARESSVKALAELRSLVRGIHPPVLADRGLPAAVKALALDMPLLTHVGSDLAGRPPGAVESAAYFAVSELLANVSKHASARVIWLDIRHSGGMLRISVSDNGYGGADPARGTGLAGIERRLAAFDGVLAVSSPPGGPTVVNLEIPCTLSSSKTSSC